MALSQSPRGSRLALDLVLVTESLRIFHTDDIRQGCQGPLNDRSPNDTIQGQNPLRTVPMA